MFFKKIIKITNNIINASNINSLQTILQQIYLKENGYTSYQQIPQNKKTDYNNFIQEQKKYISEYIQNKLKNKTYQSWIYDILKNKNQQIEDIPKLIKQLQKLQNIIKYQDKLKSQKITINRQDFNIANFKTYKELHQFVNKYYSYIEKNIKQQETKNKPLNFKKYFDLANYSIYEIGYDDQQQFQQIYGDKGWNTGWCVAQGTVEFDAYFDSDYPFYILITTQRNKPIALISLSDLQFKDVHDQPFSKLDENICKILDEILDYYDIKLFGEDANVDQDEWNDFENYCQYSIFKNESDIDNSQKIIYKDTINSLKIYKANPQYYQYQIKTIYITQNDDIKMILDIKRFNRLYYYNNNIKQNFIEDFYLFMKKYYPYQIGAVVFKHYDNIFKYFNLDTYYKEIMDSLTSNLITNIIAVNNNFSQEITFDCIKKLTYENSIYNTNLIERIYSETKNKKLKEYINSIFTTRDQLKNFKEQLKTANNEKKQQIFNIILNKSNTLQSLRILVPYVVDVNNKLQKETINQLFFEHQYSLLVKIFTTKNIDLTIKNYIFDKLVEIQPFGIMGLFGVYNDLTTEQKQRLKKSLNPNNAKHVLLGNYINHLDEEAIREIFHNLSLDTIIREFISKHNVIPNHLIDIIWESVIQKDVAYIYSLIKHKLPLTQNALSLIYNSNWQNQSKERFFEDAILGYIPQINQKGINLIIQFCKKNKIYPNLLNKLK